MCYIAVMVEHQLKENRPEKFVLSPALGIAVPIGYTIHGIDVSTHQDVIDWQLISQMNLNDLRVQFAFIKATEGVSSVDKQFERNWQMSKLAGISRGAYHFFIATKDGVHQAQNFINTVKLEAGDLPPVVDIEELYGASPDSMRTALQTFLNTIENAYHVKPIIYCYADFYEEYLKNVFDEYPLWLAHYNIENAQNDKDKKVSIRKWTFWQHSQDAHINGITPKVDVDVFNGDSTDFKKLLLK